MKTFTVLVPEPIGRLIELEAASKGVDPAALCAGVLAEHFLSYQNPDLRTLPPSETRGEDQMAFNVADNFKGLPRYSIDFAQAIVDEALRIGNVRAFKSNRGIGFEPNFVFVEYLREQAPGGVGLSFYGGPERHENKLIGNGRTASYSRARVRTPAELQSILPHVRKAFGFKFGK